MTRAAIVAEAKTWCGTRWAHQQSKKGVGADCIGLIAGVARALGIDGADEFDRSVKGYGREPDPVQTLKWCAQLLEPATDLLPGNILYLRVPKVAHPLHFALVSDGGYMIHSNVTIGRVVEHRLDDVWRSRIARVFAYRGLA